jgi:GcrA cell cycle regulator
MVINSDEFSGASPVEEIPGRWECRDFPEIRAFKAPAAIGAQTMRCDAWTVERIALLKELWAEGETAAAIAARLGGMSRSAVLGKVFRLRLRTDDAVAPLQAKGRTAARNSRKEVERVARRRRGGKHGNPQQSPPLTGIQRKTLLELTNKTCRWPHGRPGTAKFFFCGAPDADLENGIPYCARHMRRAYSASASVGNRGPATSHW